MGFNSGFKGLNSRLGTRDCFYLLAVRLKPKLRSIADWVEPRFRVDALQTEHSRIANGNGPGIAQSV